MGDSRATKSFFLFRGFNIPKTGVVETRDYLRHVVGWLEIWLKIFHLANFLSLVGIGVILLLAAVDVANQVGMKIQNGAPALGRIRPDRHCRCRTPLHPSIAVSSDLCEHDDR